jgi:hypothetical protein
MAVRIRKPEENLSTSVSTKNFRRNWQSLAIGPDGLRTGSFPMAGNITVCLGKLQPRNGTQETGRYKQEDIQYCSERVCFRLGNRGKKFSETNISQHVNEILTVPTS